MSHTEPAAVDIPVGTAASVISVRPVVLPAAGRGEELQLRVTAPTTGRDLPIVVFSHGFGLSMDDYAPLVDCWAADGLVVLQPTHLDSRTLGLAPDDPRTPLIWRVRIEDLTRVIDELDLIERSVPGLGGRLNRGRDRHGRALRVTAAYLRSSLDLGDDQWLRVRTDLQDDRHPLGRLESR
ncbi:MAG TPA: hypothetical protein VHW04_22880 [Solirubrobacteraceae bacterium]|nr:hypothetical protein [Solirubrobacteraceae bacterium]